MNKQLNLQSMEHVIGELTTKEWPPQGDLITFTKLTQRIHNCGDSLDFLKAAKNADEILDELTLFLKKCMSSTNWKYRVCGLIFLDYLFDYDKDHFEVTFVILNDDRRELQDLFWGVLEDPELRVVEFMGRTKYIALPDYHLSVHGVNEIDEWLETGFPDCSEEQDKTFNYELLFQRTTAIAPPFRRKYFLSVLIPFLRIGRVDHPQLGPIFRQILNLLRPQNNSVMVSGRMLKDVYLGWLYTTPPLNFPDWEDIGKELLEAYTVLMNDYISLFHSKTYLSKLKTFFSELSMKEWPPEINQSSFVQLSQTIHEYADTLVIWDAIDALSHKLDDDFNYGMLNQVNDGFKDAPSIDQIDRELDYLISYLKTCMSDANWKLRVCGLVFINYLNYSNKIKDIDVYFYQDTELPDLFWGRLEDPELRVVEYMGRTRYMARGDDWFSKKVKDDGMYINWSATSSARINSFNYKFLFRRVSELSPAIQRDYFFGVLSQYLHGDYKKQTKLVQVYNLILDLVLPENSIIGAHWGVIHDLNYKWYHVSPPCNYPDWKNIGEALIKAGAPIYNDDYW